MHILLEPLKRLSHEGISLHDPEGVAQQVYPRFLSMVGDHPEISGRVCHVQLGHSTDPVPDVWLRARAWMTSACGTQPGQHRRKQR